MVSDDSTIQIKSVLDRNNTIELQSELNVVKCIEKVYYTFTYRKLVNSDAYDYHTDMVHYSLNATSMLEFADPTGSARSWWSHDYPYRVKRRLLAL